MILSTEEFKKRAIHLGVRMEHDSGSLEYNDTVCCLNEVDKKRIIKEIETGPVAKGLKAAFAKTYEL